MAHASRLNEKMLATAIISGIAGIAATTLLSRAAAPKTSAGFWNSHDEESDSTNYLLVGGLCSLIAAGAALLLAPKSGRELRQDITDRYEEISDHAHDIKDQAYGYANNFAKKAKKMAHRVHDDIEDSGEEYYDSFKDKVAQFADVAEAGLKIWNSISRGR